jgi:hypothetical protein
MEVVPAWLLEMASDRNLAHVVGNYRVGLSQEGGDEQPGQAMVQYPRDRLEHFHSLGCCQ